MIGVVVASTQVTLPLDWSSYCSFVVAAVVASEAEKVVFTVPRTAAPSAGNVDSVSVGSVLSTMTSTESVAAGLANASCELRNTSQSPSLAAA